MQVPVSKSYKWMYPYLVMRKTTLCLALTCQKRYTYLYPHTHTYTDRHMKHTISSSSSLDRQITHYIIWTCDVFKLIQLDLLKMEQPNYGPGPHLHGHREIVLGFWREEHVHCFLWKWLITSWWCPHFNDVQLSRYRSFRWIAGYAKRFIYHYKGESC